MYIFFMNANYSHVLVLLNIVRALLQLGVSSVQVPRCPARIQLDISKFGRRVK